ncbi:MAG TPA: glycine reductase [Syntrophomonadaceae bacterium]|jgi:hypothetical protein|nr:glycine reductase [Syntrophomonadaceae bacterium]
MTEAVMRELFRETLLDVAEEIRNPQGGKKTCIGLTTLGTEVNPQDLIRGAELAMAKDRHLQVILIGSQQDDRFPCYLADNEADVHGTLEELLDTKTIDGVVTMHYPFPIGVSTVGKISTPARGKSVYIATSTGSSDTNRVQAMIKNTVYGIIAAKTDGVSDPAVGILNIEGARQVERHLLQMQENGYDFTWGESQRGDKGHILRGNDLIAGSVDIVVTDTLTGNLLVKLFSAFTSGGNYETIGYGYGPGIGENFNRLVCILSRASGTPVTANAIEYCASMARNRWDKIRQQEIQKAKKAGWLLPEAPAAATRKKADITMPPEKVCDAQIAGIDILELDDAVRSLWENNIYASSGMGCTGPVILVAGEDKDRSEDVLRAHGYL